ncbi:MAG: hypothetical protein Q9178_004886 [Gyalolechia marmorata]
MAAYGWTSYDTRTGGSHVVNDTGNRVDIITHFSKNTPGSWGLRVKSNPRQDAASLQQTSIIFYLGIESAGATRNCESKLGGNIVCSGRTSHSGNYTILIMDHQSDDTSASRSSVKSLTIPSDSIWQAKSILSDELKSPSSQVGLLENRAGQGNLHFVQKIFTGAFEFDVLFSSDASPESLDSEVLTKGILKDFLGFEEHWGLVYAPQEPFESTVHAIFSQHLLSNLLGGIGHFYGKSRFDASSAQVYAETDLKFWEKAAAARAHAHVEDAGPHELFSTVPSRPFFPRGFLWDEGFHLLVVLDWDMDLALEIVSSWFDLMNEDGWIAREQILGPEARSKVPPEFQVQYPHYANPPTLFLVVAAFVQHLENPSSYVGAPSQYLGDVSLARSFLRDIFPKLKRHHQWFCRTQAGNLTRYRLPGTSISQGYRWRGRTPQHTLTSGLDDYPRAQPPHPEELHVDALSWVGTMAKTLKQLSAFLRMEQDEKTFAIQEVEIARTDGTKPKKVCHKGYVSLLPFCLGLTSQDSPHLGAILNLILDPEELWSPFGIRSLSIRDKYFGKDEDYWRGHIWININYMILERLLVSLYLREAEFPLLTEKQELTQQPGLHRSRAGNIYTQLRLNLVNTVFDAWNETGFAWEQYNANTGKGQRTQHFTGWTALIVKILAMPHVAHISPVDDTGLPSAVFSKDSPDPQLYIIAVALPFFLYFFRRRLIKLWRTFV